MNTKVSIWGLEIPKNIFNTTYLQTQAFLSSGTPYAMEFIRISQNELIEPNKDRKVQSYHYIYVGASILVMRIHFGHIN